MAEPSVVRIWAGQSASVVNYDSGFAVSVGDLCILWKSGSPSSVGTGLPTFTTGGADAGFTTAASGTSNNGTGSKASMFYKVLTSSDISGGNLVGYSANQGGTTTLRIGMMVFHHANGFDSATCKVTLVSPTTGVFNTNTAAPAVVATLTDVARPVIAVSVCTGSGSSQQYTWAGAPTGNTATRDPYTDDTGATNTQGGHGAARVDSTGVTINNGSTSHSDSNIIAADLGSLLSPGFPTGTYITAVTPGVGFTSSAAATFGNTTVTLAAPHYGTGAATLQADYQTFDTADTPGNVTLQTSTAANGYVAITAEFQAQAPITDVTVSNTVGITNSTSRLTATSRSLANTVGVTNTTTGVRASARTVTNTVGVTNALAGTVAATATFNNTVGVTNTMVLPGRFTAANTVGVTNTVTRQQTNSRTFANTVDITGTLNIAGTHPRTFANTVGIANVFVPHETTSRSTTNTISITNSLSVASSYTIVDGDIHVPITAPLGYITDGVVHVTARKANTSDIADISVMLISDGTTLAVSAWQPLTDTFTDYTLNVHVHIPDTTTVYVGWQVRTRPGDVVTPQISTLTGFDYIGAILNTVGITNTVIPTVRRALANPVGITNALTTVTTVPAQSTTVTFNNTVAITNGISQSLTSLRTVTNTVGITNSIVVAVTGGGSRATSATVTIAPQWAAEVTANRQWAAEVV